jgi:Tfp pilus assembly protein PilF
MKENPDVARELMLTCLDTKRADEAVEIAEHGVRLADGDAGLKANLALALLCAGQLSRAETAIEAAIQQDPQDEISMTLRRLIAEVKSGERKQPQTPADLET